MSEIEGKAATGSGERVGRRASFKSMDQSCSCLTNPCNPWFETRSFPKSLAAALAALPSMSLLPVAPLKLAPFPSRLLLASQLYLLRRSSRSLRSASVSAIRVHGRHRLRST